MKKRQITIINPTSGKQAITENQEIWVQLDEQPISAMQYCLDVLYGKMRHDPDFGPAYLDGLRQAQKDLDHLVNLAAGNPPDTTKKSSLLRQLAASTEFAQVSKSLIEKAERMERQAEGLRYKFSRDRKEAAGK